MQWLLNHSPVFYRNAINTGLPIFESAEAVGETSTGDIIELNTSTGEIKNVTTGKTYHSEPYPDFIEKIIGAGGLVQYLKDNLRTITD